MSRNVEDALAALRECSEHYRAELDRDGAKARAWLEQAAEDLLAKISELDRTDGGSKTHARTLKSDEARGADRKRSIRHEGWGLGAG